MRPHRVRNPHQLRQRAIALLLPRALHGFCKRFVPAGVGSSIMMTIGARKNSAIEKCIGRARVGRHLRGSELPNAVRN